MQVLRSAARRNFMYARPDIPHGVYKSLVIRGELRRGREGYEITDQGRLLLDRGSQYAGRGGGLSASPARRGPRIKPATRLVVCSTSDFGTR